MYSNEDVECFLPENYIPKEYITDFLHNGTDYNASKEEIEALQTVMQSAVKSGQ